MPARIALLRAVNVGGHRPVAMADLRGLLSGLGFGGAQSLLQSGNLVFRQDGATDAELEELLEREADARLGLRTDVMVRGAQVWRSLVEANPFAQEATRDPGRVLVYALKDAPDADRIAALRAVISGPEAVRGHGAHLFAHYPDGVGRSKLTLALIERTLATRATGRNWNTVLKLDALASAP